MSAAMTVYGRAAEIVSRVEAGLSAMTAPMVDDRANAAASIRGDVQALVELLIETREDANDVREVLAYRDMEVFLCRRKLGPAAPSWREVQESLARSRRRRGERASDRGPRADTAGADR